MNVDPTKASAEKPASRDESQHLVVFGDRRCRQRLQQTQQFVSIAEPAACQLSNYEPVAKDASVIERLGQSVVALPEMFDPDRCVDQCRHDDGARRRGIGRRPFSDPPKAAKRRALSSAISASRPRRTRAVFSFMPVNRAAFSSNSSSMLMVVRICTNMHSSYRCVKKRAVGMRPCRIP